ncbi:MAG: DUF3306 domain-containing protein [Wenzhouxiangella sp.]|jgi:hypothetical protein|nr:DUF3306 domain-containing protein [Wenzhouxiangella sp.]
MSEDEGFLQRWSRRKQDAAREESEAEPVEQSESEELEAGSDPSLHDADAAVTAEASEAAQTQTDEDEPEPPGDEDMPPLESLDHGGSIKPFMSPRVSQGLRRAALKRLFRQPKYNVVDMLDDYAEDYSKPVALGNIVTADMRYRAEQAAKRMARIYKESGAKSDAEEGAIEQAPDTETVAADQAGPAQQPKAEETEVPESEQLADSGETRAPDEDEVQGSDRKPG